MDHANGTLLATTVAMLRDRSGMESISKATGLSVDWLRKLRSGQITDPSVNKVQQLYEHLTGHPLLPH